MKTLVCLLALMTCGHAQRTAAYRSATLSAIDKGALCKSASPVEGAVDLSASFDEDRVYVQVKTKQGRPLCLYTDTGGALLLTEDAVNQLGLKPKPVNDPELAKEIGPTATTIPASGFNDATGAPGILGSAFFVVLPQIRQLPEIPPQGDGILGQAWFGGRVWTWNYPMQKLTLRKENWQPAGGAVPLPVHFKVDGAGTRVTNFPRIEIQADGQSISMLLDTGAETYLQRDALSRIGDHGPAFRATSMITKSIFEQWHTKHPEWRMIEAAQAGTHSPMIEVPDLTIGGIHIGKVWFTERPDRNFHEFMSSMMDSQVEGSIGGNALHSLEITVDYPNSKAWVANSKR